MITRDEARAAFAASGLTYDDVLDRTSLSELRGVLAIRLKASGLFPHTDKADGPGTFRMETGVKIMDVPGKRWAALCCKARYFDRREAVTFNPEGFVGFAGWASEENVQPILEGFLEWVATRVARKADGTAVAA